MMIVLRTTDAQIVKHILEACRGKLNQVFRQAAPAVRNRIGVICDALIEQTDEYHSLLHGELLGELGIPNVEDRVRSVLNTIKRGIVVEAVPVRIAGDRLTGGMTASLLRSDYADLLSLGAATYISAPSSLPIPWLDWLLLQGDKVVVFDYASDFSLSAAEKARSRTGMALMRPGAGWRVPPAFAGVAHDNFLTRAFDVPGVEALFARIFQQEIERRL